MINVFRFRFKTHPLIIQYLTLPWSFYQLKCQWGVTSKTFWEMGQTHLPVLFKELCCCGEVRNRAFTMGTPWRGEQTDRSVMNEPEDLSSHNDTLLIKSSEGIHACTVSLYSPSSGRTQRQLRQDSIHVIQHCCLNHLVCMQVDSSNGTGINWTDVDLPI